MRWIIRPAAAFPSPLPEKVQLGFDPDPRFLSRIWVNVDRHKLTIDDSDLKPIPGRCLRWKSGSIHDELQLVIADEKNGVHIVDYPVDNGMGRFTFKGHRQLLAL